MTKNRHHAIALSATFVAVLLALSGCNKTDSVPTPTAAAGAPETPTTPAYTPPTADQLSQMVAPIALFPDKLVAQVLAGATYPDQISSANQWLGQNPALKGDVLQAAEDKEPWDVSVKSLTQFPAVLSQMASNPDWTRQLGDAFVNDPNDVMNAIQALRQRAQQAGNLKNSGQLRVASVARAAEPAQYVNAPGAPVVYAGAPVVPPPPETIVIESAQPDTVYVPRYDPAVVYGGPVPVYPGYAYRPPSPVGNEIVVGALSFGVGIVVGEAISHHGDWGWHDWGMHWGGPVERDRPASDWQRPAVVYKNTTYVSHSTTVINRVTNNVTVNNTRITNNTSNTNNFNNNTSNVRNTTNVNNVNTVNNAQTRIENRQEPAPRAQPAATPMSMPHFTAGDTRPGAAPNAHAQAQAMAAPHERAQQEAAIQAQEHQREQEQQEQQAEANRRKMMEEKAAPAPATHAPEMKAANVKPQPAPAEHKENVPPHPARELQAAPARAPAQKPEAERPQNHAAQAHEVEKNVEKNLGKGAEKHEEKREEPREGKPEAKHEDKKEEGHHEPEKHNG
ncbi:DUF3300 domain-containing protein [Herbaspirillum sp. NPDC087042]|uniref:DUF3300 domain-containing protein n=1 Tax=Herbaspirillum sp. NPDC087042 TaxID=3364004 RepID=UPI0037F8B17A